MYFAIESFLDLVSLEFNEFANDRFAVRDQLLEGLGEGVGHRLEPECALDLATGRTRMLLRNARIGDLAFNRTDNSLWGVRHDNGPVVARQQQLPVLPPGGGRR